MLISFIFSYSERCFVLFYPPLIFHRAHCACRWPPPRQGRWARTASYPFAAPRWGCAWRVPTASVLGCVRCSAWRVWTRSLTRPVSHTVRHSTGDSAGATRLFRVDADTSSFGSEDATPGSRACVHVLVLLGRVGLAVLLGAFWCASSFFWPLFLSALLDPLRAGVAPLLFLCLPSFLLPCSLCAPLLSPSFSGFRPRVPWALALLFPFPPAFFLYAPSLSLAFSGLQPRVPPALALCVGCFVGLPLLGSSCAVAAFVFSASLLGDPWWLLPPPPFGVSGFRPCRSVPPLFSFLCCFALARLLGDRRRFSPSAAPPPPLVCFVGLPLLGSPFAFGAFVFPARPLAAPWWLLSPPPLIVSRGFCRCCPVPPPLFFFSAALPLPSCLMLVGGSRRLLPLQPPSSCFFFSRCSALCALSVLLCFSLSRWLLRCGCCPPPPLLCVPVSAAAARWSVFFFAALLLLACSSAVLAVCCPPVRGALPCCVVGCCAPCGVCWGVCLLVAAACCAVSLVLPSGWVVCGVVCCFGLRCRVLCCAVCPWVRCCAALLRVVPPGVALLCAVLFCCARLVPLLLSRALWRCLSPWGPALCRAALCGVPPRCVLCAVCVLSWRVDACCCSLLCFVLCVSWGVLLCVPCALRSVR